MEAEGKNCSMPWKNGIYHSRSMPSMLFEVNGEKIVTYSASGKPTGIEDNPRANGTWKFGDFGDVHPDVLKETGKNRYNVESITWGGLFKIPMVVSDDGKLMTFFGLAKCVDYMDWLSEEALAEYIASGHPQDDLPHPYKVQPDNQGKLVWISGPPGLGKSTSAMLLGKNEDYVYYEADCFMHHVNPYVSTDVDEPSLMMIRQMFLKGIPQERIDDVATGLNPFIDFLEGKEYDHEKVCKFYGAMCKNVKSEKKRIGGNFVIAQAVPTRKIRDFIRNILGDSLLFVVLNMNREDQLERIKKRNGEEVEGAIEAMTKSHKLFELAADNEENAINYQITKDLSRDDVVKKILGLIKDQTNL